MVVYIGYMERDAAKRIKMISSIWRQFMLEYSFCRKQINLQQEIRNTYVSEIIGYFQDTLDIVMNFDKLLLNGNDLSSYISLLQSIYVQQDLIEELLLIFKLNIVKGDLKKDENYSINRNIRNELIGHPIRKYNKELISSCLFGYNDDPEKLIYLRYHKENQYKFELIEVSIDEIIGRHVLFLNTYLDRIESKIKRVLKKYLEKLRLVESFIENKSFIEVLDLSNKFFESIFNSEHLYNRDDLLCIYLKREEHNRYQNFINTFYSDLKQSLIETIEYVISIIEPYNMCENIEGNKLDLDFDFFNDESSCEDTEIKEFNYDYYLSKLSSKKNDFNLNFYFNCLHKEYINNELITCELKNMENNLHNDIEYYTSLMLIYSELDNE